MIELKYGYIGTRCPSCSKNIILPVNRFQFASGITLSCPDCGTPVINIKKKCSSENIAVSCFACGNTHKYSVSQKSFFSQMPSSFCCKENDVDVLYTGNYEDIDNALFQLERELAVLSDKYYNNIEQLYGNYTMSALRIIEEKAREKRIICLCGSNDVNLKLSEGGVELICPCCGGAEFIPTANEDDVTALMERRSILIK